VVTPDGAAQLAAARLGAKLLAPGEARTARLVVRMRAVGPRGSAKAVVEKARELDAALLPATLEGAAEEAADAHAAGDPRRAEVIVGAQVRLIRASGPAARAAAMALAEHAGAFSSMMREWAADADEYGRDGAAREAADAVEGMRFVRRTRDRLRFTAMSVNLRLGLYRRNQVKMYIRRTAILALTHVVEYCPLRARLDSDPEEIDSPKAAVYAPECEVRLPDGARIAPGGVRVLARRRRLDANARGDIGRLRRLGAVVEMKGL